MNIYYTGIGARKTPEPVLRDIKYLATYLAQKDLILRSGGAKGADTAFEQGCNKVKGRKEIYLPWKNFNNNSSKLYLTNNSYYGIAEDIAKSFHPNWNSLSEAGRLMMIRNTYQIWGLNLSYQSSFVICWTPNGEIIGGTGQAIRLANKYRIPVFNFGSLSRDDLLNQVVKYLNSLGKL